MSDDQCDPRVQWPLPPAWMFDCEDCVRLYGRMKRITDMMWEMHFTGEKGVDYDPMDSQVGSMIAMIRHMAMAHEELLPDWEPDCPSCAERRQSIARAVARSASPDAVVVLQEHRAAHAVLPPHSAKNL
ncbi:MULTISPECIES: hypothetical protein [Streptomyces]|uniref:Uncharacterized protein n=1 Tax=Streptomyces lichenis TaxID=2306967 RepID=A0ABT0I883_9ACTN|nr:hypothetical protein [Streptomyces lichenis]MCK8677534.1 hypothetical protein [Streptomyces lichenis]